MEFHGAGYRLIFNSATGFTTTNENIFTGEKGKT